MPLRENPIHTPVSPPHREVSPHSRDRRLRHPCPENPRSFPALRPGETNLPERAKESALQTNGVNGHQHEVSEKRVNPGTFPCRLDIELCACGAKRWVNLKGRPATPWQFINLGTRPRGQECATDISQVGDGRADHLRELCQPMTLDDTQEDHKPATSAGRARATARAGARRRGCTPAAQRSCSSATCCKRS